MRAGDKARLTVIKAILSDITYAEKAAGTAAPPSISTLIQRSLKKRRDSIAQFREGRREDLAATEEAEIKLLETYLPKQLTPEELEKVVREVVDKVGATTVKDLGKVMKEVGARVDDSMAPKKVVSEVVKRVLQSL
ncbi:hypothetical protein HK104_002537 [Borealophlyctis nickersoniae]|nr:hypothetical protein HK104_002537 [Borealophlyctis nickersoniae]